MTFKQLRQEKNSLQNRLNIRSREVKLKTQEIKRLLNVLDTEQKVNRMLENRINFEVEEKQLAFKKLAEATKEKNDYYEWCINEIDKKNKTENKLIIGLTVSMFVVTALVVVLIKVL